MKRSRILIIGVVILAGSASQAAGGSAVQGGP